MDIFVLFLVSEGVFSFHHFMCDISSVLVVYGFIALRYIPARPVFEVLTMKGYWILSNAFLAPLASSYSAFIVLCDVSCLLIWVW